MDIGKHHGLYYISRNQEIICQLDTVPLVNHHDSLDLPELMVLEALLNYSLNKVRSKISLARTTIVE